MHGQLPRNLDEKLVDIYVFWNFNILITPMRAMQGLQVLPEDRADKRRNVS